ncbi:uncharacterized protein Z518_06097 [Rhinocladiella mackenziei CBS 650.93]|uniref:Uncharacterized protein n=1 Tax=Rhinocladiella mackenziei CBS 650.93 TaxID=1442369 RepID=A0A0D2J834_9EURO|nr:uncharacterized protein Z518_06097 [Rhinocladiella mackenziei CBS 650.93]KIX05225.1 hypothetical protein Z518_06097 [Rhinocladiella mackenziei CBS 650.93]
MPSTLEYQVTKSEQANMKLIYAGFVDLLIADNKDPYTLMEFKNIQIPYLGLKIQGRQILLNN